MSPDRIIVKSDELRETELILWFPLSYKHEWKWWTTTIGLPRTRRSLWACPVKLLLIGKHMMTSQQSFEVYICSGLHIHLHDFTHMILELPSLLLTFARRGVNNFTQIMVITFCDLIRLSFLLIADLILNTSLAAYIHSWYNFFTITWFTVWTMFLAAVCFALRITFWKEYHCALQNCFNFRYNPFPLMFDFSKLNTPGTHSGRYSDCPTESTRLVSLMCVVPDNSQIFLCN